jgi:hypothetical protein
MHQATQRCSEKSCGRGESLHLPASPVAVDLAEYHSELRSTIPVEPRALAKNPNRWLPAAPPLQLLEQTVSVSGCILEHLTFDLSILFSKAGKLWRPLADPQHHDCQTSHPAGHNIYPLIFHASLAHHFIAINFKQITFDDAIWAYKPGFFVATYHASR